MLGGLVAQVVCEGGLLVVGVGFVVTPAIVLKVNCDDACTTLWISCSDC